MQDQINQLNTRIDTLERLLQGNFEELIRNTVFFDQDTNNSGGSTTSVVTAVDFVHQTTTSTNILSVAPTKFVRMYFRGQIYNVPVYAIS